VSSRTFAILATVVGSAIGAWWLTSQRTPRRTGQRLPSRDHGTVIFDNHATASPLSEGVL
jgi:hypothetical protein